MKKWINNNEFTWYSVIFIIMSIIVFFPFIFKGKLFIYTDVGADTIYSYWPMYKYIIDSIRHGTLSLWSFTLGIGTDILSISSMLFDPFNIILLFFKSKYIVYGILLSMILKMYLSGIIFKIYLNMIGINKKVSIISALIWAFNGFIILWGQHYMFASAIVLFTLIILGLEKFLKEKDCRIFVIALILQLIASPYMAYMTTIYIFLYSIIRYCYKNKIKIKSFIRYILNLIKVYLISIGLSAIIFIPTCFLILDSPRVAGIKRSLPQIINNSFEIAVSFLRVFGNNLCGTNDFIGNSNYYEVIILSSSVLMIILIPQLFIVIKDRKNKWIVSLSIILVLISIISPIVAYTFNAFSIVAYRWSYIIIFSNVIAGTIAFDNMIQTKNINKYLLVGSVIIIIFLLLFLLVYVFYSIDKNIQIKSICFLLIQAIFLIFLIISFNLLILAYTKTKKIKYIYFLSFFVICELMLNSYITFNHRSVLSKSYITSNQGYYDSTANAVKNIQENDITFYRIDKEFVSQGWNDSLFQGYYGLPTYNSLNSRGYIEFSSEYNNNKLYNENQFGNFNGDYFLRSFLGVKYIFSKYMIEDCKYELIKKVDDIYIYKNNNVFPLGFTYNNYVLKDDFVAGSYSKKVETIMNNAVLEKKTAYASKQIVDDNESVKDFIMSFENINLINNEENKIEYTPTSEDPNIIIDLPNTIVDGLVLEFELDTNKKINGQIFYSNDKKFDETNSFKFDITPNNKYYNIPINTKNINHIRLDIGEKDKITCIKKLTINKRRSIDGILNERDIFNIDKFAQSHIVGNIEAKSNEILMWTIPYTKGWNIKVDGKKVNTINTNNGFIGIEISQGKHQIEMRYIPKGFKFGSIISFITVIILIVNRVRKSKKIYKSL